MEPITLYYDTSGTVQNAKEQMSYHHGKHIDKKYHLFIEIVNRGDFMVSKIASADNLMDLFTKSLPAKVFDGHLEDGYSWYFICTLKGKWKIVSFISFEWYIVKRNYELIFDRLHVIIWNTYLRFHDHIRRHKLYIDIEYSETLL